MDQFAVYIVVSDGAIENNSLCDGLSTFCIEYILPYDLTSKINDITLNTNVLKTTYHIWSNVSDYIYASLDQENCEFFWGIFTKEV